MKSWIIFGASAVGLVVVALYLYRRLNPAPSAITQTYTNETDKSTITVGPAVVRPAKSLSGKKNWGTDRAIVTDGKIIA